MGLPYRNRHETACYWCKRCTVLRGYILQVLVSRSWHVYLPVALNATGAGSVVRTVHHVTVSCAVAEVLCADYLTVPLYILFMYHNTIWQMTRGAKKALFNNPSIIYRIPDTIFLGSVYVLLSA